MDSTALHTAFRSDVVDEVGPFLWTDDEVYRYMGDAYSMFVRLTGGVADFLSAATAVPIVAGQPVADLHPSVMRVMSATRRSDTKPIDIINPTDVGKMRSSDYGQTKSIVMDTRSGPVRYMVLGLQRNKVRWVQVPEVDDVADLQIYRMPLVAITGEDQELVDVAEEHHIHLLNWMKHLAYKKQDADTFDAQASAKGKADFESYCALVKAEWERYKHKSRATSYGGI